MIGGKHKAKKGNVGKIGGEKKFVSKWKTVRDEVKYAVVVKRSRGVTTFLDKVRPIFNYNSTKVSFRLKIHKI